MVFWHDDRQTIVIPMVFWPDDHQTLGIPIGNHPCEVRKYVNQDDIQPARTLSGRAMMKLYDLTNSWEAKGP